MLFKNKSYCDYIGLANETNYFSVATSKKLNVIKSKKVHLYNDMSRQNR